METAGSIVDQVIDRPQLTFNRDGIIAKGVNPLAPLIFVYGRISSGSLVVACSMLFEVRRSLTVAIVPSDTSFCVIEVTAGISSENEVRVG